MTTNADVRELRLIPPEVKMIEFLKVRPESEIDWDWDSPNLSPNGRILVANLINKGLIKEVEYVTDARALAHRTTIKLTDLGHAVAKTIDQHTVKVTPASDTDAGADS